jgi:alanyl-tRNA synthetase
VGPDRLRFDFTHGTALTKEQIKQVEDFVNDACLRNISLVIQASIK